MAENATHLPSRNGAACGFRPVPTDPRDYSPNDPSCAVCAKILKGMKDNTDRIMAAAAEAQRRAAATAAPKKRSEDKSE